MRVSQLYAMLSGLGAGFPQTPVVALVLLANSGSHPDPNATCISCVWLYDDESQRVGSKLDHLDLNIIAKAEKWLWYSKRTDHVFHPSAFDSTHLSPQTLVPTKSVRSRRLELSKIFVPKLRWELGNCLDFIMFHHVSFACWPEVPSLCMNKAEWRFYFGYADQQAKLLCRESLKLCGAKECHLLSGTPALGRLYATRRAMSGTRHVSVQKSRPLNILWGQALTAQLAKDKSSWKRVSQPFFQALPHESSPRDRWTSPARGGVAELAEGKLKCIGSWRILNPRHCLPLTIHVATVSAVSDFERTDFVMFTL